MNKCDHCCGMHQIDLHTNKDELNESEEYVYIDGDKLAIETYQYTGGLSNVIQIQINYCPMCGRKL